MRQLVLASSSPRRRQILEQAGYDVRTSSVKVSEIPKKNLNLAAQIQDIAHRKAQTLVSADKSLKSKEILVLSADTVVILDNVLLGKPENRVQNQHYIEQLSGKKHLVMTAVCLWQPEPEKIITFHEGSIVLFRDLSQNEIRQYAETEEGLDKAGGYGIQGEGGKLVEKYYGSYLNIVGLPLEKLEEVLKKNDWQLRRKES